MEITVRRVRRTIETRAKEEWKDKVKEMLIKNENTLMAVGMFSLSLSILIGFLHVEWFGFSVSDFMKGMLLGISVVLNLTFLIRRRSKKKASIHNDSRV